MINWPFTASIAEKPERFYNPKNPDYLSIPWRELYSSNEIPSGSVLTPEEFKMLYNVELPPTSSGTGFTTEWVVTSTDTDGRVVQIPIYDAGYPFDFIVNWGDGTSNHITTWNDPAVFHTYSADGTYDIEIRGECPAWSTGYWTDNFTYADSSKVKKVINWGDPSIFGGFSVFNDAFEYCNDLKSIPGYLILKPECLDLHDAFSYCVGLSDISPDLFRNATQITSVNGLFYGDGSIYSLPESLFKYSPVITDFGQMLSGCSMPTIPANFFKYNTLATNFAYTFYGSDIAVLPSDSFQYNTLANSFLGCFFFCASLTTVPDYLFRYNTAVSNFNTTFCTCNNLQINPNVFYANGEQSTRFLNQSVDFYECMSRDVFGGVQGTAADLWNCNFGTGTPNTTLCYGGAGNTTSSISNYNDIPTAWTS